jgi:hypothetical protein
VTDAPALESKQLSNRKESPKLAAGRNSDKNSLARKPSSAGGGFMLVGQALSKEQEKRIVRGGGRICYLLRSNFYFMLLREGESSICVFVNLYLCDK